MLVHSLGTDSKICLGDNKSTTITNDTVVEVVELDGEGHVEKAPPP